MYHVGVLEYLLETFDSITRGALCRILGSAVSDIQWLQARLPVAMGGLGLRAADDHAPVAYASSLLASKRLVDGLLGKADEEVIANSMTGTFEFEKGDKREMPDFNVFYRHDATYPFYSHAVWFLTQMRRWGQIPEEKPDAWYDEVAKKVYRPDVYRKAAEALVAEGKIEASEIPDTDGYKAPDAGFIDGVVYDGRKPNAYLAEFEVGLQSKSKTAAAK